jgi:hypothetical protein
MCSLELGAGDLNESTDKAGGYHGYWAEDLYAINSNYGSAADLKSLVSTAHQKVRLYMPFFFFFLHSHCIGYVRHD